MSAARLDHDATSRRIARVGVRFSLHMFVRMAVRTAVPMFVLLSTLALLTACSSAPRTPTASATSSRSSSASSAPHTTPAGRATDLERRNNVAMHAMGLLERPYRWGGRGPATGFDCSGLVSHVFWESIGLRVRGSAADMGRQAQPLARHELQAGDLVFFNTLGARHSHVGVYVGEGRFVHASNPRTGVRMDRLSNRYYAERFEGGGRLLD